MPVLCHRIILRHEDRAKGASASGRDGRNSRPRCPCRRRSEMKPSFNGKKASYSVSSYFVICVIAGVAGRSRFHRGGDCVHYPRFFYGDHLGAHARPAALGRSQPFPARGRARLRRKPPFLRRHFFPQRENHQQENPPRLDASGTCPPRGTNADCFRRHRWRKQPSALREDFRFVELPRRETGSPFALDRRPLPPAISSISIERKKSSPTRKRWWYTQGSCRSPESSFPSGIISAFIPPRASSRIRPGTRGRGNTRATSPRKTSTGRQAPASMSYRRRFSSRPRIRRYFFSWTGRAFKRADDRAGLRGRPGNRRFACLALRRDGGFVRDGHRSFRQGFPPRSFLSAEVPNTWAWSWNSLPAAISSGVRPSSLSLGA